MSNERARDRGIKENCLDDRGSRREPCKVHGVTCLTFLDLFKVQSVLRVLYMYGVVIKRKEFQLNWNPCCDSMAIDHVTIITAHIWWLQDSTVVLDSTLSH